MRRGAQDSRAGAGRRGLKMAGIELIPSADRVVTSLRDLGYDFAQAVADVVDNSISAGASEIDINVTFEGDDSSVTITDNGHGMTDSRLREALRYGSKREYDKTDLGKFGLGLKTASLSQCQRLSVGSKSKGSAISAYTWDLDHITKSNRWEILPLSGKGLPSQIRAGLSNGSGTVVHWERLDRILGYKHPYGAVAKKRLLQMCREIEAHLTMVFHQFLAGNVRGRKIRIRLNENELRPWDPFCEQQRKTRRLPTEKFTIEHEGSRGTVRIEPYILPSQQEFSTPQAFKDAAGPMGWNLQQGFYFYRAERMIQSGGWSKLRVPDEHTKLARIAVHFPPELDDAFKINVAKMRVQLPAQLRDMIEESVSAICKQAREAYDRKGGGHQGHPPSPPPPKGGNGGRPGKPSNRSEKLFSLNEWAELMMHAARASEKRIVKAVLKRISD